MRVILPHICQQHIDELQRLRAGSGDEYVTYGPLGSADVLVGPGWCAYDDIARQLPHGWTPEVFLSWQIEYNTLPRGIEEADCLTVGVVGDWNLFGQAAHLIGGAFDVLIADEPGTTMLRGLGLPNVHTVPIWSHTPKLHRVIPGVRRDIDILMIGNLHQDIQRDRARWIARVARLSRRYRVFIGSGINGEDYVRMMNRARIVFNRTLSGAVNMRAYEAAACGALLFHEADSPTIRSVFADREECVLYRDDDLEELLAYYLTHEEERARIAEAGRQAVAEHSQAGALARILEIAQSTIGARQGCARPFRSLGHPERHLRHATHGTMTVFRTDLPHALAAANMAQSRMPARADVAVARACILAESAMGVQPGPLRTKLLDGALAACERAVELLPNYAAAMYNQAYVHVVQGRPDAAIQTLSKALHALYSEELTPECLLGPYFPRNYNLFTVELERVWAAHRALTTAWAEEMRELLAWRCWEVLSDLAHESKRMAESAQFAGEATALRPNSPMTRYRLATALRELGQLEQAEAEYRRALEDGPLSVPVWLELADVLRRRDKWSDCLALTDELLTIIDGCPAFESARAPLEEAARLVRQQILQPGFAQAA